MELPEAVKNRSGALWDCIGRREASPGYIYRFKLKEDEVITSSLKEQIDRLHQEYEQTYPDLEQGAYYFKRPELIQWEKVFRGLGCKIDWEKEGVFLELPDPEALIDKWNDLIEKMKQKHPEISLSPLRINVVDKKISDREYVKSFLKNDITLSTKSTCIHDYQFHGIPTLLFMMRQEYAAIKKDIVNAIQNIHSKFEAARGWIDTAEKKGIDAVFIQYYGSIRLTLPELKKYLPKIEGALAEIVDGYASAAQIRKEHYKPVTEKEVLKKMWDLESSLFRLRDQVAKYKPHLIQEPFTAELEFASRFPESEFPLTCEKIWLFLLELESQIKN